ncbi:hypothetical protein BJ138DRAFT_1019557, partial [Hygrophoropsis aurantiaca]
RCRAPPDQLATEGPPRFREHTEVLVETFEADDLWDAFGIVGDVIPYTNYFPRADIHELLTPDLLHQLIKGTFKDHLVQWVEDYVYSVPDRTAREAKAIMDDIDRRIAAAPPFPGLRRFHEGRNFKQWTGNDSKALMKIYLAAIVGHVPDDVVRCFSAFLDFCYLARRSAHDTTSLDAMDNALHHFHRYRVVFEAVGVRPNGFSLPRQHALVHYVRNIKLFGSPNGLCSSITESRHITAVKRPWRRSSRNQPLGEMIRTNTRLSKIAAARVEFGRRGMLKNDVLSHALQATGLDWEDGVNDAEQDSEEAYSRTVHRLGLELGHPILPQLIRRFLYDQLYPNDPVPGAEVPLDECPLFDGHISVYHSATATFYAPSELAGPGGMHREMIRANPAWRKAYPRFDTVLIQNGGEDDVMNGMIIGRVIRFLSFVHQETRYPCVLVEWFLPVGDGPDPLTGMWVVEPEVIDGVPTIGIVHTDCIFRACHLMPRFGGDTQLPYDFHFSYTLDAFQSFYLNKYIDYHSHECAP